MRALLIPTEGPPEEVSLPDEEQLPELQRLVGGWIEAVGLRADVIGYIDEEGKLAGKPQNYLATQTALWKGGIDTRDNIVGPMVLVGFDAETGESRDLPEDVVFDVQKGALIL